MKKKTIKSRRGETYVDTGVKILAAVVCGALVLGSVFWILKDTVLTNVKTKVSDMLNGPDINPMEDVMWEPGVEKVPSTGALWSMEGNTLTEYKGELTAGMSLVIPNEVDGVRVIRVQNAETVKTDAAKRLNIFGTTSNSTVSSITISEGIKEIGDCAFINCTGLTGDLVIPDLVRFVGYKSFEGCTGLNGKLILPDSLTNIDACAFQSCSGLTGDLVFPDAIKTIGLGTFNKCSNMQGILILPSTVTDIGTGAFQFCGFTGLLTLPETLTTIGDYAFNQCKGFTGPLTLPAGLTYLGKTSFQLCNFNGPLTLPTALTEIKDFTFNSCMALSGPLNIPAGTKSIGQQAFYKCSSFTSLTLPDGLEIIGHNALTQCTGMKNTLVIPDSVKVLDLCAFNHDSNFNNTSLVLPSSLEVFGNTMMFYNFATATCASASIAASNPNFKTVDGVLYSKDGSQLLFYPPQKSGASFAIPEGVTFLNELSFSRNTQLKSVTLPNSYVIQTTDMPANFANKPWSNSLNLGLYVYTGVFNVEAKPDNPRYASVDGILYSKDLKSLWYMPVARTGALVIREGVERLEYGSLNLKWASSLYIPASVTYIDSTVLAAFTDDAPSVPITIDPNNPKYQVVDKKVVTK